MSLVLSLFFVWLFGEHMLTNREDFPSVFRFALGEHSASHHVSHEHDPHGSWLDILTATWTVETTGRDRMHGFQVF